MPPWRNPFPLKRGASPERDYDGSSASGESYDMDEVIDVSPDYDGSSISPTDSTYDGGSIYTETYDSDNSEWDEEEAIREPDVMEAMRKFQDHQALQHVVDSSAMIDTAQLDQDDGNVSHNLDTRTVETGLGEVGSHLPHAVDSTPVVSPIDASTLREMIIPLTQKRKELHKLREQVDAKIHEAPRQIASRFKADFQRSLVNLGDYFKPFQSLLKWIDSHYGTDVFAYFIFALWMISMNLVSVVFTFFFGMVPTIFWHDRHGGQAAVVIRHEDRPFRAVDLVTGENYLKDSFLHYGFYLSDRAFILGGWYYDRTLGYLFALAFFFMFQFIVIIYSLTKSYRSLVSSSLLGAKSKYCDTVFFLWEYTTRARVAVRLNKLNIRTTLRELLVTEKRKRFQKNLYLRRIFVNFGVLLLIIGVAAGLWFLLGTLPIPARSLATPPVEPDVPVVLTSTTELMESSTESTEGTSPISVPDNYKAGMELLPIILITGANLFLPFLFSLVAQQEEYSSYEKELAMSIIKGVILNIGSLGILYFYWLTRRSGQDPRNLDVVNRQCRSFQRVACWESDLSAKFYQLVIMNVLFEWGSSILVSGSVAIQRLVSKRKWTPVFRADLLTQRIIYLQIITWFASYYSPLICVLAVVSTILSVTREALIVRYTKFYKSAPLGSASEGVHVIYSSALLGSFLVAAISVAFAVTMYIPSNQCGPFQTLCPQPDIIVAAVARLEEYSQDLYIVLDLLITPAVLIFIILVLLVFIYYYHVKSEAFNELIPVLQNHLALEGKDQIALYLHEVQQQARLERKRQTKGEASKADGRRASGARDRSTARRRRPSRPAALGTLTTHLDKNTAKTRV